MKILKSAGFQLAELLVVLIIAGILVAIAMPVYNYITVRGHRTQAATMLIKLASAMEQYQGVNNSYAKATLKKLQFPEFVADNNYQLVIQSTSQRYLLIAIPIGKQAVKDKGCAALTLNSNGQKSVSGTKPSEDCW